MNLLKSLKMLNEDTIEIVYQDNIKIEVEDMKDAFIKLDEFTKRQRLKKLVVIGKNTEISRDARNYGHFESKTRKSIIIAEALVVHTLGQKMAANLYSGFIKESYPTKYFTDVEKAREWLAAI